jgi:hypothetical protein
MVTRVVVPWFPRVGHLILANIKYPRGDK